MNYMHLMNTLSRSVEVFEPLHPPLVGLYTCGPTVYHFAHLGNLRAYIFEDVLKRVLLLNGFDVQHVMNITDVGHLTSDSDTGEDKMVKGARREGKTAWEVAAFYTEHFKRDIASLNILEPVVWCKATDHIEEQIALVKRLEKKGFTYSISGDGVYFDTSKFSSYGTLGRLNIEGLKEGARVEFVEGKRNKSDFALWKFSPFGEKRDMEWESPWGKGFPGWHIECSAMAMKYLGESFDIHCGGVDHIQVHHTNEIAQAEAVTGKKFVKYWLHNEFLIFGDQAKMAKSGDSFLTMQSLHDRDIPPLAYRYLCLSAHYRSKLQFSWESLDAAKTALQKLEQFVLDVRGGESAGDWVKYRDEFLDSVNDDLDTPKALAVVWGVVKDEVLGAGTKYDALLFFDRVLGLGFSELKKERVPEEVKELVRQREIARSERDWDRSDSLRKDIALLGWIVEDSNSGPKIRRAV